MKNKKILWILLLVVVIVAIVLAVLFIKPKSNEEPVVNAIGSEKKTENIIVENKVSETNDESNYQKIQLDDGVLYTSTGEKVTADIVLGNNYFDTTINDMYINPDSYKNKYIEIEGMYLINRPYTFVGRFSENNLCAYCPTGYSYMEYQLDGKIDAKLVDQDTWIKVIGTLEIGQDEGSNYEDYCYIKVVNLEVMNERGQETVYN